MRFAQRQGAYFSPLRSNRTLGTVPALVRRIALYRLLLVFSVTATLAGCGAVQEADSSPSENRSEPPPESTLSHGERTVTGTPGLHCWGGDRSSVAEHGEGDGCGGSTSASSDASSGFPPFTGEPLVVAKGASLTFVFGGSLPPDELVVEVVPLEGSEPRLEENGRPSPLINPPVLRRSKEAEITVDLTRDYYGVSVWVANREGYGYYGFRVRVR